MSSTAVEPQQIYSIKIEYTGLHTDRLIGRQAELTTIANALNDTGNTYLIHLTAPGGFGKSRLLHHILAHPSTQIRLLTPDRPIDFYYSRFHGIAHVYGGVLESLNSRTAIGDEPDEPAETITWQTFAGMALFDQSRHNLTENFVTRLNHLSAQRRLMLAFDTVERLAVIDPLWESLGGRDKPLTILDWLLDDIFPRLRNTVIILAGRFDPDGRLGIRLRNHAREHGQKFLPLPLPGLSEAEALEYFEAITEMAGKTKKNLDIGGWLKHLPDEWRLAIFYCLSELDLFTNSQRISPLWLALAIDHLLLAAQPLEEFMLPLETVKAFTSAQRYALRQKLATELIRVLQNGWYRDENMLSALAWLPKGASAEMVSKIFGYPETEVAEALQRLQQLSFVTTHEGTERTFLHDEMYDLFESFGIANRFGPQNERTHIRLNEYYREIIKQTEKTLADHFKGVDRTDRITNPYFLIHLRSVAQELSTEDIYYRLRFDRSEGVDGYYVYVEEAFNSKNLTLMMYLQTELLLFLYRFGSDGIGVSRQEILAMLEIQQVKRLIMEEQYQAAQARVRRLHTEEADIIQQGGPLATLELDTWRGYLLIRDGQLGEAEGLLIRAKKELQHLLEEAWRSSRLLVVLARTCTCLGECYQAREKFKNAAGAYNQAIPLWHSADIKSAEAAARDGKAQVMAQLGYFSAARSQALDSLNLNINLGLSAASTTNYNTLAIIAILRDDYNQARDWALASLHIAVRLDYHDAAGLAQLQLAAIYRFQSEDWYLSNEIKHQLLGKGLLAAESALDIFSNIVPVAEHETQAYYQRGLIRREMLRLAATEAEKTGLLQQAEDDLQIARQRSQNQPIAALEYDLALAWLYFYAGQPDRLEATRTAIHEWINTHFDYYLIRPGYLPNAENKTFRVFEQLMLLHVLQGTIEMDRFDQQAQVETLSSAAREFTWAMEYSRYLPNNSIQTRRTIDGIIDQLKSLNTVELKTFYQAVIETEHELQISDILTKMELIEIVATEQELQISDSHCILWAELEEYFGPYEMLLDIEDH